MYQARAVPLALLAAVALQIALTPGPERGLAALRGRGGLGRPGARPVTHGPRVELHEELAEKSLADPDPPGWAFVLFDTHPTAMQRIEHGAGMAGAQPPPFAIASRFTKVNCAKEGPDASSHTGSARGSARLPGPLRRRVSGGPVALEDLRQVDPGDPALHHRLPAADRRGSAAVHRVLRDPVHEEVAAGAVRLHRPDLPLDRERLRVRPAAAARRVPALLRGAPGSIR